MFWFKPEIRAIKGLKVLVKLGKIKGTVKAFKNPEILKSLKVQINFYI